MECDDLILPFCVSGAQFGTVISMPLSGVLSEYGFAGGWPSIFYVFGAIGTLWSVAFLWLVHEDPESHPTIPHDERKYIISSVWGAAGVSVSIFHTVNFNPRGCLCTQYIWCVYIYIYKYIYGHYIIHILYTWTVTVYSGIIIIKRTQFMGFQNDKYTTRVLTPSFYNRCTTGVFRASTPTQGVV